MQRSETKLPAGKTCADCTHFSRCRWLVGATEAWTECDWTPGRFALASQPSTGAQQ